MHKLMRYIKGYEKQALLAPLFKMLEACFELFVPLVIASIIDTGIKNEDAAFIWTRCGLLVLLAAIGLASSLTAQWFSAKAALGFGTALRKDLFRHIGTLSYSELDGIGTPTLVTRMTSDINQVQNGVNLTLRLLLRSPFIVIGAPRRTGRRGACLRRTADRQHHRDEHHERPGRKLLRDLQPERHHQLRRHGGIPHRRCQLL